MEPQYSLADLVPVLSKQLGQPVSFLSSWPYQRTFWLLQLLRSLKYSVLVGESTNDSVVVQRMLEGVSVVVMEALLVLIAHTRRQLGLLHMLVALF